MNFKQLLLPGALALGTFAFGSPAFGITVNVTEFSFPELTTVQVVDAPIGVNYSGQAGRFDGMLLETPALQPILSISTVSDVVPTSFTAYCAELTQSLSFGFSYSTYVRDTALTDFGAQKAADLSRLFTAYSTSVVDGATSAAMQAGIWEIIYEQGTNYSLTSGVLTVSSLDSTFQSKLDQVSSVLGHLSTYATNYRIDILGSPDAQDLLVATAISPAPEPGTWALLGGGLALLAVARRRRSN